MAEVQHAGRLWGGRFAGGPAEAMAVLSRSTHFDWRLAPYDLAGSRAHARALQRAGLLTDDELAGMLTGLDRVGQEVATGELLPDDSDEVLLASLFDSLLDSPVEPFEPAFESPDDESEPAPVDGLVELDLPRLSVL